MPSFRWSEENAGVLHAATWRRLLELLGVAGLLGVAAGLGLRRYPVV